MARAEPVGVRLHTHSFFASMQQVARLGNEAAFAGRLVLFNLTSNRWQKSLLRTIKDGGNAANIVIMGTGHAAKPTGDARVTILATEAVTISANELGERRCRATGTLYPSTKAPLQPAMRSSRATPAPRSLLERPTGHLSNLRSLARPSSKGTTPRNADAVNRCRIC